MVVDIPPCRVFASPVLRPGPNLKWADCLSLGNGTLGLLGASDTALSLWDPTDMIASKAFAASKPFVKPVFGLITSVCLLTESNGPDRVLVLSDIGTLTAFRVARDRLALELDFQVWLTFLSICHSIHSWVLSSWNVKKRLMSEV
jgi:hypothetical protein